MQRSKRISQGGIFRLTITAMFTALIVLFAFTPVGYLKTAGLEISFIMLPVTIGSVIGGPAAGAFLGAVFGLTSFIQCFGMSAFGAALLGVDPFLTFLVCVPTRILAGFLPGLIFRCFSKKEKLRYFGAGLCSLLGPLFNTLFFMTVLLLCFGKTEFIQNIFVSTGAKNMLVFAFVFVGVQGAVEAGVTFVLGTAVSSALLRFSTNKKLN